MSGDLTNADLITLETAWWFDSFVIFTIQSELRIRCHIFSLGFFFFSPWNDYPWWHTGPSGENSLQLQIIMPSPQAWEHFPNSRSLIFRYPSQFWDKCIMLCVICLKYIHIVACPLWSYTPKIIVCVMFSIPLRTQLYHISTCSIRPWHIYLFHFGCLAFNSWMHEGTIFLHYINPNIWSRSPYFPVADEDLPMLVIYSSSSPLHPHFCISLLKGKGKIYTCVYNRMFCYLLCLPVLSCKKQSSISYSWVYPVSGYTSNYSFNGFYFTC